MPDHFLYDTGEFGFGFGPRLRSRFITQSFQFFTTGEAHERAVQTVTMSDAETVVRQVGANAWRPHFVVGALLREADASFTPRLGGVRAGAILPFCELEQWVGQLNALGQPNPITFNVYPGPDRSFLLFQDDGVTPGAPNRLTQISQSTNGAARTVRIQRRVDNYAPVETYYFVAFLGQPQAPASVVVAGTPLPNVNTPAALAASPGNAYYWNQSIEITFVKVLDAAATADVTVTQG